MNSIRTVPQMIFACINTNMYRYEPDIEFRVNGYGRQYEYSEFVEMIKKCKKLGIACDNLTDHLPEFKRELALFNRMQPEEQLPPGM